MLSSSYFYHARFVADELRRLLPAESFAAKMWKAIGAELHFRLSEWPLYEIEPGLSRRCPVEALFLWTINDGGLDPTWIANDTGEYLDEHDFPLPADITPTVTAAEQLAVYGLWLVKVHVDSKGPMVNEGTNKYGWSREQLLGHHNDCVALGYQALTYAQRPARLDEIEKAKSDHFAALGRKGSDVKHGRHREAKQRVLDMWSTGHYPNKQDCARKATSDKLLAVSLETARGWLQGVPDPDPWPAKRKK